MTFASFLVCVFGGKRAFNGHIFAGRVRCPARVLEAARGKMGKVLVRRRPPQSAPNFNHHIHENRPYCPHLPRRGCLRCRYFCRPRPAVLGRSSCRAGRQEGREPSCFRPQGKIRGFVGFHERQTARARQRDKVQGRLLVLLSGLPNPKTRSGYLSSRSFLFHVSFQHLPHFAQLTFALLG